MVPEQASVSMVRTAIRRAAHQLLDLPRILEDPIAVGLVPEATEQAILATADEHRASAARSEVRAPAEDPRRDQSGMAGRRVLRGAR